MASVPGGEEAGGRCRKTEKLPGSGSKVPQDCIHHNISVVTNNLVSVNTKKLLTPDGVSCDTSGAVLDSPTQLQTVKKEMRNRIK